MQKFLPAHDKLVHFYAGLPMGFFFFLLLQITLPQAKLWWALTALFFSALVAFGFEWFSLLSGMGVYDIGDAIATLLGSLPGIWAAWKGFT